MDLFFNSTSSISFSLLSDTIMDQSLLMWATFLFFVLILLIFDLGVLNKKDHEIGFKESLWMSAFYIFVAFLFGLWVFYKLGMNSFAEYMTGFLVEKSLSLDNIFVISLIFSKLAIPPKYQHRVLFWGIISGVLLLRAVMIGLGAQIVSEFEWVLYIFALFMIFTGIKMLFISHKPVEIEKNVVLQWMRRHLRITDKLHEQQFIVRQVDPKSKEKKIFFTPLFVALVLVEFIDLVFAVDSIPAIFTITQDPYIVYTSNIFAVLGLRALYFALASMINRFHYLQYALGAILIFIGSKIFLPHLLGIKKIPPALSLVVTISLLVLGCVYSIIKPPAGKDLSH